MQFQKALRIKGAEFAVQHKIIRFGNREKFFVIFHDCFKKAIIYFFCACAQELAGIAHAVIKNLCTAKCSI